MKRPAMMTAAGILGALAAGSAPVNAGDFYALTDLGVLPDETGAVAKAINNNGEVVGESGNRVFLWHDGEMAELWAPGQVYAINDSAQVVGRWNFNGWKPVLWEDGDLTELETSVASNSFPRDINGDGFIVGDIYADAVIWDGADLLGIIFPGSGNALNNNLQAVGGGGGSSEAKLWDNGFVEVIITRGTVLDINDSAQVVGYNYNGPDAFSWQDGTLTWLPESPQTNRSKAVAINASGWAVGRSFSSSSGGINKPVLWKDGRVIDLARALIHDPDWTLTFVTGINDSGQIIGGAINAEGQTRAVLLTPTSIYDQDADGDVDLLDYAAFQNAFTGP